MVLTESAITVTREDIWGLLGYEPTDSQRKILDSSRRQVQVLGGFRGGKSRTMSMMALLLTVQFIARYGDRAGGQVAWLVGQDYERCRAEWEHPDGSLSLDFAKLGMLKWVSNTIDPGRMEIFVPGADKPFTIRTKSAADPTSLGMESPIWIMIVEAAHVTHDVYERLYSRTSEARTRWGSPFGALLMSGTSEGAQGWYPAMYTAWQSPVIQDVLDVESFSLPSHSNVYIYPGGELNPEIMHLKETLPENVYRERPLGIPVPPSGLVHPAFDKNVHIRECEYDVNLPLWLGMDPGYSGQPSNYVVAVWQYQGEQWRAIDEIWMNKFKNPNFTHEDMVHACQMKPWWKSVEKNMCTAWIDVSAERHADANRPAVEIWRKHAGLTVLSKKVGLNAGIDRMDAMLKVNSFTGEPNAVLSPKCELGISEFGAGPNPQTGNLSPYQWPAKSDGTVTGTRPTDAHNDFIKASTYLFKNLLGAVSVSPRTAKTIRSTSIEERLRRQGIY